MNNENNITPNNLKVGWILTTLLLVLAISEGYAQPASCDYHVSGRVVDAHGQPIKGVDVFVSPYFSSSSKAFDLIEESTVTDADGRFSISIKAMIGSLQHLYTSVPSEGDDLISSPFSFLSERDKRLLGKRLKLGTNKIVDMGDVPVQFYYGDLKLKITNFGKYLTETDWKKLWIVLYNNRNIILYEQSIGPTIKKPEIDISTSTAFYSLPEGKYRVEFRSFDDDKVPLKIGSRALGSTQLFEIVRSETVNLAIDLR